MSSTNQEHVFRTSAWIILIFGVACSAALAGGVAFLLNNEQRSTLEWVLLSLWTVAWIFPLLVFAGRVTQRVIVSPSGLRIAHGFGHNMEIAWPNLEWWQIVYVPGAEGSHIEVRLKRKDAKRTRCVYDNEVGVPSFREFIGAMRAHVPHLEIPAKAPEEVLRRVDVPNTPKSPGSSC